jgi:hypothetical protein
MVAPLSSRFSRRQPMEAMLGPESRQRAGLLSLPADEVRCLEQSGGVELLLKRSIIHSNPLCSKLRERALSVTDAITFAGNPFACSATMPSLTVRLASPARASSVRID